MYKTMIAFVTLLSVITSVHAENDDTVTIRWTPPSERVNGDSFDPVTELERYEFYCGDIEPIYISGYSTVSEYSFDKSGYFTEPGSYDCFMAAVDSDGLYSDWVQLDKPVEYDSGVIGAPLDFQVL